MNAAEIDGLDWAKGAGLVPAVVQHADTRAVLMLGYMDRAALERTLADRRVTFYSRTRGRLWTKGETSGNYIGLEAIRVDCDRDTLLITGRPLGPVCHTGAADCFGGAPDGGAPGLAFLGTLEAIIQARLDAPTDTSYTSRLCAEGPLRVAQKVGEEGLEVALAAAAAGSEAVLAESADLVFHLLVLLRSRGLSFGEVVRLLESRYASRSGG